MVTNRKIQNDNEISNSRAAIDAHLHDTFAGVLRRRAATGANIATIRAERLAKWDALGRELDRNGWHELEAALEAAQESVRLRHLSIAGAEKPIDPCEAEQLSERFADDCRRIITAGGAMALWHIIVADLNIPHVSINGFVDGREADDPVTEPQCEMLVDTARCYALAAIAGATGAGSWESLRSLFGQQCLDADLEVYAPFAVDNDPESHTTRTRQAAFEFATATTNARRIEATETYAFAFEMASTSYTLTAVQRLGLIAWLARRGIKGELRSRAPRSESRLRSGCTNDSEASALRPSRRL